MITSLQNQRIKNVVKLTVDARERRSQNLFVVEGARELSLAITGGYTIQSLFVCEEFINQSSKDLIDKLRRISVEKVNTEVFQKMAYRDQSDGVIAVMEASHMSLNDIQLPDNPFIIALEAVEKPGNLGAILRTADAAQVDAVIVCDPACDIYNPNTIRSSIGCVFTQQVVTCTSNEAYQWLKQNEINIFAAELTASQWYHETDFTKPSAIVMGTEAVGLSDFWLKNADRRIKIPMRGYIDSLNVSVSTAILTFEAMRQRRK